MPRDRNAPSPPVGADTWTTDERRAFADDLTHSQLLAVSAASNRSKADKGPDLWAAAAAVALALLLPRLDPRQAATG
ncbi:hypothetical protein ACFRMQ_15360 [Kitasatospora sp. NPDC056783]|uniref:hypothetical protein n=1 Tax=Kitasatospora sp. NPDC056783 TaxID=3345943 RepID=UPI0036B886AF